MNSIEEKRNKTVHKIQFDKYLQETKAQIEQINKGIEVKKHLGKNTYCHYTYDKKNPQLHSVENCITINASSRH